MALLTKRQKEILDFIKAFVDERGYAPSLMEIGQNFGLSSPATVYQHLKGLEKKGFLQRGWNKKRSVTFTEQVEARSSDVVELPLLGTIAAGLPIEAVLDSETVSVPQNLVRAGRCFALRVRGTSMIDDHIMDGDVVIVQSATRAENGQTVVALVEGSQATLKRFYRDAEQVRLQPANESLSPMLFAPEQVAVQGVVVGLLRRF